MYHYVYKITNINEIKFYYGSRSCNCFPTEDLGKKYFSSSHDKQFIKDQHENSNNFEYKILGIFNTKEEAVELEIKLHKLFDVKSNELFYNKANQTSTKFDTTGIEPWNKGNKGNGGYKLSEDAPQRQKWSDERRKKHSKRLLGHRKKQTINYKKTSKNKVIIIDENGNKKKVDKNHWDKTKEKSIMKDTIMSINLKNGSHKRISINEFFNNKFYIAPGTKWFYKYKNGVYRKCDLELLKKKENNNDSMYSFIKKTKKINLYEYLNEITKR